MFFRKCEAKGQLVDISSDVFGKYRFCTGYAGVMYADSDFTAGAGCGKPRKGAIPAPGQAETRPFGSYMGPSRKHREKTQDERRSEEQQAHDLLEQLARDAEPVGLAKLDELFSQAQAEYAKDLAGYRFESKRWGDFLSIFTARMGNPVQWKDQFFYIEKPEQAYSTSINLKNVHAIRLIEGHGADLAGQLSYGYVLESDDRESRCSGTNDGNYLAPEGYHWSVWPQFPDIPYSRPLFYMKPQKKKDERRPIDLSAYSYEIKHVTDNYVRPAKDDHILFEGIDAKLFVPAGEGARVYQEILAAKESCQS